MKTKYKKMIHIKAKGKQNIQEDSYIRKAKEPQKVSTVYPGANGAPKNGNCEHDIIHPHSNGKRRAPNKSPASFGPELVASFGPELVAY